MKAPFTILTCMTLLIGIALSARAQTEIPKPAPELKKLDYFAGRWAAEGDIKPGPMGPGGKFTGTNRVQWMDGGFFLVTHSEFNGAMGKGTETSYMGYDGNDKMYTYDSFNTLGEADHAKGNVDGDTWTWQSETRMGPQTIKGRLTLKVLSATAYNFKFEMSPRWHHLEHRTGRQRHEEIDSRRMSNFYAQKPVNVPSVPGFPEFP
jgi:Protein of unknown function (DUF1579)